MPASGNSLLRNSENDWALENRTINLRVVAEVAEALKHLNDKVGFEGHGAELVQWPKLRGGRDRW